MSSRARSTSAPPLVPNMTPIIDVTFLLLVFFLCQIRFRQLDGTLDTFLPREIGAATTPAEPSLDGPRVRLTRDGDGTIVAVNGRVLEWIAGSHAAEAPRLPRVESALRGLREKWPELPADLEPDPGVPVGHVVAVLDAAIAARVASVRFTIAPERR